jgi:hypothetical protein
MFVALFSCELLHSHDLLILDKHICESCVDIQHHWYIASASAQVMRMQSWWPGNTKVQMFAKQTSHGGSIIIYLAPSTMHSYWHNCQINWSWECEFRVTDECQVVFILHPTEAESLPTSIPCAASAADCPYRKTTCWLPAGPYDWTCYTLQHCCTTAW